MSKLRNDAKLFDEVALIVIGFDDARTANETAASILDAVDRHQRMAAIEKAKFRYKHREYDCAGCGAPGCVAEQARIERTSTEGTPGAPAEPAGKRICPELLMSEIPREGACRGCGRRESVDVGPDHFCADCRSLRNRILYGNESLCRGCGKTLVVENFRVADGCPCNSARGINHGLVPILTCTCAECDPAQTGSTRSTVGAPLTPVGEPARCSGVCEGPDGAGIQCSGPRGHDGAHRHVWAAEPPVLQEPGASATKEKP